MEKLYHKINAIGISNLVIGIVTILVGVGAGVTMIVNGARLITGYYILRDLWSLEQIVKNK